MQFLGALLSRDYQWQSRYVGLAVLAIPIGALLAMPLTKASWLSRARIVAPRTDSMTFQPHIHWTSHLFRRTIFTMLLPFAALGYCLSARGPPFSWVAAVIFAGLLGFLTDLGIAECIGVIMETFDTCDLQPGVNTKHRYTSMSSVVKRRRTNYSSFPRVCAAFFLAQSLGFFLSAVATGVSGHTTRVYGAQIAIAIVAAILLGVTIALLAIIWRWKQVQVIPHYTADAQSGQKAYEPQPDDPEWKAVIIGNPAGKMRRMNILELGRWTRWTEIRKLNRLIPE